MAIDIKIILARRAFNGMREDVYETIASSMIKDGVPLNECLRKLADRAKQDKDSVAPLYKLWLRRLGDTSMKGEFTLCIRPDIPNSDYMVLRGFEQSGNLAAGIMYQSGLIRKMRKMRSEFIGSMAKPIISFLAISGVAAFFATASRGFLDVAPLSKWPVPSQVMFQFTIFMDHYLTYILSVFIFTLVWIVWACGNWGDRNAKLRHKMDSYLPFVMYRDFTSFSTMIVLSSLMSAKIPLGVATKMIMESGSPWIKSYFKIISRRLGDSRMKSPAEAYNVGFFPKRIYYRVLDVSERGGFDEAIKSIAEDSFVRMESEMKKRAFILDQMVMAVTGLIAGLIAMGLTSAIGAMTSIIKSAS